jgi:hypothetical protein
LLNLSRKILEKEDFIYFLLLEQYSDFAGALKLSKVHKSYFSLRYVHSFALVFLMKIYKHFLRDFVLEKIKKRFQAQKFKMAVEFKMNVKTVLSFKTWNFNYFLIFLQDCLNLANCSCSGRVSRVQQSFFTLLSVVFTLNFLLCRIRLFHKSCHT